MALEEAKELNTLGTLLDVKNADKRLFSVEAINLFLSEQRITLANVERWLHKKIEKMNKSIE